MKLISKGDHHNDFGRRSRPEYTMHPSGGRKKGTTTTAGSMPSLTLENRNMIDDRSNNNTAAVLFSRSYPGTRYQL